MVDSYCKLCKVENEEEEKPQSEESNDLEIPFTCKNGHGLIFYPEGTHKKRDNGSGPYTSTSTQLGCNGCGNMFEVSEHGGYYSCRELCDWDMCPKCLLCDNKHQLKIQLGNPYAHMGPGASARCDRCRNAIDTDQPFFRCAQCSYDVCRNCIPEIDCQQQQPIEIAPCSRCDGKKF